MLGRLGLLRSLGQLFELGHGGVAFFLLVGGLGELFRQRVELLRFRRVSFFLLRLGDLLLFGVFTALVDQRKGAFGEGLHHGRRWRHGRVDYHADIGGQGNEGLR